MEDIITVLRNHGIQPTPQRIAVAQYVLDSKAHPSADEVLDAVRRKFPTVSRATVYNTLNLFVDKRLLRAQVIREGSNVFDPNIDRHHHFIDESTGRVYDIPWNRLSVSGEKALDDFEVHEYQVVLRGRLKKKRR